MYTKTARQILRITFCYNLILLIFEAYHKHGKVRGETPVFREEVIPMGEDLFEIVADSVIVEVTDPLISKGSTCLDKAVIHGNRSAIGKILVFVTADDVVF